MQPTEQQYGGRMGQNQQMKTNISSDLVLVQERFKEAKTSEEREQIFTDLKKVPHLLNAFLKLNKKNVYSID